MSILKKVSLPEADIVLDFMGDGQGRVHIANHGGNSYSYYWGAMGCSLDKFICSVSSDYFCNNLVSNKWDFDSAGTFKKLREFIKSELSLPWYRYPEFQKDMRQKLREFQGDVTTLNEFVFGWDSFISSLDFYLIDDRYDQREIEKNFKNVSEVWHFGSTKPSREYLWVEKIHKKLVEYIKSEKWTSGIS